MFYKKKIDEYSREATRELYERERKLNELQSKIINAEKSLEERKNTFFQVVDSYRENTPVIAKMYADALFASDTKLANKLRIKKFPAKALSAEIKKVYAKELRELRFKLKEYEYLIEKYRSLYPEAEDNDFNVDTEEVVEIEDENPERKYLSKEEWSALSVSERNQLALDRYLSAKHTKAHIGKMYERYVGYLYEKQGYSVIYNGIERGLSDCGLDLICKKGSDVVLIQCKCWSKSSTIYEKHIAQFLGSCAFYKITNIGDLFTKYHYRFYSTADLGETAIKFATELGIDIYMQAFNKHYPIIKCNINGDDKIYHLPFDQQYDKVKLNKSGEFYAVSVKQAEGMGFRRAKRWVPETK